jgi:hypothetical protein
VRLQAPGSRPQTRLYFVGSYAEGKESEVRTLDLASYFDVTIGPQRRRSRQKEDWQTKKYFWARFRYDHIFKAEGETKVAPEYRGVEPSVARQLDRLPSTSGLYAFALVARWYY